MSDQEQETACLVPTEPGYWWARYDGCPAHVHRVYDCAFVGDAAWDWLAEVPDPAVCAAWVAAGRPGPEVLRAVGQYDAARRRIVELAPVGGTSLASPGAVPAAVEAFKAARDRLNVVLGLAQDAALRPARDGAGEVAP